MRVLALATAALALSACVPLPTPDQVDGVISIIDIAGGLIGEAR